MEFFFSFSALYINSFIHRLKICLCPPGQGKDIYSTDSLFMCRFCTIIFTQTNPTYVALQQIQHSKFHSTVSIYLPYKITQEEYKRTWIQSNWSLNCDHFIHSVFPHCTDWEKKIIFQLLALSLLGKQQDNLRKTLKCGNYSDISSVSGRVSFQWSS